MLTIESLHQIQDLQSSLTSYILGNQKNFKYPSIGKQFKLVSKLEDINRHLLFGILWFYIYVFDTEDSRSVMREIGYSNLFLFVKEIIQNKNRKVAKLAKLIFEVIYRDNFQKELDSNGVPIEIAQNNITHLLGIIQWVYIYQKEEVSTILNYLDIIAKNLDNYPYFLKFRFLEEQVDSSLDITIPNHYLNDSHVFSLFYGLYLTEWYEKSRSGILLRYEETKKSKFLVDKFLALLKKKNLSLENFLVCLLKKKNDWNPRSNNYLIWLVNHIPYFLSAFYQYDLRPIKKGKNWKHITKFIKDSRKDHTPYSYDYHGECVEILNKLNIKMPRELRLINSTISSGKRGLILQTNSSHFSNIHTVVTYVIQPNNDNILKTRLSGYGKHVQKIIEKL